MATSSLAKKSIWTSKHPAKYKLSGISEGRDLSVGGIMNGQRISSDEKNGQIFRFARQSGDKTNLQGTDADFLELMDMLKF